MSHLQGCPAVHGEASPITVSNGAVVRLIWIPARAKSLLNCAISRSSAGVPLAYSSLNDACAPWGTPVPHWLAPLPGLVHVDVPPGLTVQPWLCSSETALLGLNGNGFCCSTWSAKLLGGFTGTGPYVGYPSPSNALLMYVC